MIIIDETDEDDGEPTAGGRYGSSVGCADRISSSDRKSSSDESDDGEGAGSRFTTGSGGGGLCGGAFGGGGVDGVTDSFEMSPG